MKSNREAKVQQFIAGAWIEGSGDESFTIVDPSNENVLGEFPSASTVDLAAAVNAAEVGFEEWSKVSAWDRSQIILDIAANIRAHAADIAAMITSEQGKPLAESIEEVLRAADFFMWSAGETTRVYGRLVASRSTGEQRVEQIPVGPVCAFTPWNFPIILLAKKLSALLAAGCSCVIKPSEETPRAALALVQACLDAGVPPLALNVVLGNPAKISDYLIEHPSIKKVTFTGSIPVGKLLAEKAGSLMKSTTMELGGHAPVIVHDDVDLERIIPVMAGKKFYNAGQMCISPSRFYVHENIHKKFVELFSKAAASVVVGRGDQDGVQMGPLANERRLSAAIDLVDDAKAKGARLVIGGGRLYDKGYFFQPTVLDNVPDDADLMCCEPFSPIVAVTPYSDLDETIDRANGLPYGLAAYAFTTDAALQKKLSTKLEAGLVGINIMPGHLPEVPVGGWKESGQGVEGGAEALDAYLKTRYSCIDVNEH